MHTVILSAIYKRTVKKIENNMYFNLVIFAFSFKMIRT